MYVDWRASAALVGTVLTALTATLAVPVAVGVLYGEPLAPFLATGAVALTAGLALRRLDDDPDLGTREGFLVVAATWLAVGLVGTLPYLIAGQGSVAMPANALFESMSGFTTTGATVMRDISFETHTRSLLLWRQLTQWLGGMGIVVLAVAILPELSVGGAQLMDAEAPGPGIQKLTPRIAETARALWVAYLGITVLEMVLLYGLYHAGVAPNMTAYQAVAHGLTTMSTGGFSPMARSIEAFSAAVQWLIIPFMVAAGTNFALFWHALDGDLGAFRRDEEFRFYGGVLGVLAAVVAATLFTGTGLTAAASTVGGHVEPALRHGVFQAVSIVTTTGYASTDFQLWSEPAKFLLFAAIFVGGSAGSTGGAVKMVRWLVVLKAIRRELYTSVHPDAVRPIRLAGRTLDESALRGIYVFTSLYAALFVLGTVLVVLDAARVDYGVTGFTAMSAVAATLGNVGPGFGAVGPMENYAGFPATTKVFLTGLMWVGRLEVFPVLVLLTQAFWRR